MVWYNPSTWFSQSTDVAPSPYMSETPAAATSFGYGGKKRKSTRKAGKKSSKRSRTGKRSTRS
jgi:hypothetical protein